MPDNRGEYQEASPQIFAQGLFEESSTQKQALGTMRCLEDGRVFTYAKNGGTALGAGLLNQNAVVVANHLNCTVSAAVVIGAKLVIPTLGATAITANQYRNGFLHVNDVTGEGHMYKIRSHPAADASATVEITLYDKVRVALTTSSQVTLTKHPADSVVVMPTTQTGMPVGVNTFAITADYYFWLQVGGVACILTEGTVVVGNMVLPGTSTAGSVKAAATTEIIGAVGRCIRVDATTEYGLFNLNGI